MSESRTSATSGAPRSNTGWRRAVTRTQGDRPSPSADDSGTEPPPVLTVPGPVYRVAP
jgi:hypothetical protein